MPPISRWDWHANRFTWMPPRIRHWSAVSPRNWVRPPTIPERVGTRPWPRFPAPTPAGSPRAVRAGLARAYSCANSSLATDSTKEAGLRLFHNLHFCVVAVNSQVRERAVHRFINCFSCGLYPLHGLTRLSLTLRLRARLTLRLRSRSRLTLRAVVRPWLISGFDGRGFGLGLFHHFAGRLSGLAGLAGGNLSFAHGESVSALVGIRHTRAEHHVLSNYAYACRNNHIQHHSRWNHQVEICKNNRQHSLT